MKSERLHPVALPTPGREEGARGRRRVEDQRRGARTAVLLSAALAGATDFRPTRDADGRPLLSGGWHWSQSHGARAVCGVVAREPVGIDVEAVRERRVEVVRRAASDAELELLGGFSWENFFRVWTAKEAVLKKTGAGLGRLGDCRLVAADGHGGLTLLHGDREHAVHQVVARDDRDVHVLALCVEGDAVVRWDVGALLASGEVQA